MTNAKPQATAVPTDRLRPRNRTSSRSRRLPPKPAPPRARSATTKRSGSSSPPPGRRATTACTTTSDLERIRHIRELRDVAGFSLAEIGQMLEDEAVRARNRAAFHATDDVTIRRALTSSRYLERADRTAVTLKAKLELLDAMVTRDRRATGAAARASSRRFSDPNEATPMTRRRPGSLASPALSSMPSEPGLPLVGARRHEHRGAARVADLGHARHRAAGHPARPPHRPLRAALDRRRLHAGRDGPRPERRPARRSGRAGADLHRRASSCSRVASVLARARRRTPCCSSRPASSRASAARS